MTNDDTVDLEDHVVEEEEKESLWVDKALKYGLYPLYRSTEIGGKLRYFMDYGILLGLVGCMFVASNAVSFYSYSFPSNQCLISLVGAALLFYPSSK